MKKILYPCLSLALILLSSVSYSQEQAQDAAAANPVQEMQNVDPRAVQAITSAIQQGDTQGAQRIYKSLQKSQAERSSAASVQPVPVEPPKPSLFELTIPGNLKQFGYDLFNKTVSTFVPSSTMPVGPDYIVGPGDQFTLTLWGTTEGIYNLRVTKEGAVTLPKVGVISVNGVRFGELEKTLKRHLAKYYSDFNLSVAMGPLKTVTVYVVGEVAKPGSYSVSSLTTVYGALFVAGGPTKNGTLRMVRVLRAGKVVKELDLYDFLLKGDRSQDIKLQNDDTVFVPLIGPVAGIGGAVYRPAIYELRGQESIGDVINTAGGILPMALGGRLQLTRYEDNQKKVFQDIKLEEKQISGPASVDAFREKVRNMDAINIRAVYDKVWETVTISGAVQHPGEFQWRPDLSVKEVIQQGGLLPTSDLTRAEIVRLNKDFTDRQIIPVEVSSLLKGDAAQNILLQPQDEIKIYTLLKSTETVSINGAVLRPGSFNVVQGEHLSDLVRRAGGFTAEAYPYGAVFKRRGVKNAEDRNMKLVIAKTQSDIVQNLADKSATAISSEEVSLAKSEQGLNQSLLESMKAIQTLSEGRVAITITTNIDEWTGSKYDLLLQDGDVLDIPKRPQEVLVLGEVHSSGAQIHLEGMMVGDYIARSGGITKNADKDQVYVLQADGFAYSSDSPSVGDVERVKLRAGDSIIVPQKVERHAVMRNTKDIVDILFKTAVVIAAISILF